MRVELETGVSQLFCEQAGEGRDLLFLHTAGSDGRQYHHLLADPELRAAWRMTAFDLPAHGRSTPPSGLREGEWLLTTDRYVEAIVACADALALERPVALGCSMGGEICLELAYRHPDRFAAVVACQAADRVEGRQVAWAKHARVNEKLFVPEWVDGLMSPTAPAARRAEVRWAYAQSAHGVYWGDIEFYSREWDARDRVGDIDTARCPVHILAGEYDYSCTPELARATAARIPGATVHGDARARPLPDGRGPRGVPRLPAPGARRDRRRGRLTGRSRRAAALGGAARLAAAGLISKVPGVAGGSFVRRGTPRRPPPRWPPISTGSARRTRVPRSRAVPRRPDASAPRRLAAGALVQH